MATHVKYSKISNKFINQLPLIKRISDAALDKDDEEGYYVNENNPAIERGLFSRTLTISGHNKHGRGVTKGPLKLPYLKLVIPEMIADIRAVPTHKDFVEYTFPFLYATMAVMLKAFVILYNFIIQ